MRWFSLKIADYPIEIIQTQDRVVKVVKIFPALRTAPGNQFPQGGQGKFVLGE